MVTQQLQFLESQIRNQGAPALPQTDSGKPSAGTRCRRHPVPRHPVPPRPGASPDWEAIAAKGAKPAEAKDSKGKEKDTALKGAPAAAGKS